jgi:hypothetical protein
MVVVYSLVIALICGTVAGFLSAMVFQSKASYLAVVVIAAALAVIVNVGVLFTTASFFPDASIDGAAARAAGHSFWQSLAFAVAVLYWRRRRPFTAT